MATKTSKKKTVAKKTVKREPKKVVEKVEAIKVEKTEPKKEQKNKNSRLLSYKTTAILYFVCAICWFISAALNHVADSNYSFDILIAVAFLVIGILYACNIRKDNQ